MQFRRGTNLESMPDKSGGLQYSKNYVSRSRMEEVLQQEEEQLKTIQNKTIHVGGIGQKRQRHDSKNNA